jgi:hypothetical protein
MSSMSARIIVVSLNLNSAIMLVRRVQLEKHRRKARGIVPCLADVCGSRYAQEISMPGSHVRAPHKAR